MNKCKCGQTKVKDKCLRCSTHVDSRYSPSPPPVEKNQLLTASEYVQLQNGKWIPIELYLEFIKEELPCTVD